MSQQKKLLTPPPLTRNLANNTIPNNSQYYFPEITGNQLRNIEQQTVNSRGLFYKDPYNIDGYYNNSTITTHTTDPNLNPINNNLIIRGKRPPLSNSRVPLPGPTSFNPMRGSEITFRNNRRNNNTFSTITSNQNDKFLNPNRNSSQNASSLDPNRKSSQNVSSLDPNRKSSQNVSSLDPNRNSSQNASSLDPNFILRTNRFIKTTIKNQNSSSSVGKG